MPSAPGEGVVVSGNRRIQNSFRRVKELWGELPHHQQESFALFVVQELSKRPPIDLPIPTCVQCGGPLPRYARKDHQLCSDACRMRGYRDRKRGRPVTRMTMNTCSVCGTQFTAKRADAHLCSQNCRSKRYRDRKKANS